MYIIVSSSSNSAGITAFITCSIKSLLIVSLSTSSPCWVDISIVWTLTTLFPSYSTVTWVFPSGLKYSKVPFFLTSVNLLDSLWANDIGRGINSSVSLQAKPNIIPWSPAPIFSISSSVTSPFLFSKASSTPIAISPDCSSIEVITAQVSQSNPYLALSYPISFTVFLTNFGIST